MTVGGFDLVVPLRPGPAVADLDFILTFVRDQWPEAMVEDATADEGDGVPIGALFPVRLQRELLIYKDPRNLRSWTRYGATASNLGSLIYLLLGHDSVTAVVDRPTSTTGKMMTQVLHALVLNRRWAA